MVKYTSITAENPFNKPMQRQSSPQQSLNINQQVDKSVLMGNLTKSRYEYTQWRMEDYCEGLAIGAVASRQKIEGIQRLIIIQEVSSSKIRSNFNGNPIDCPLKTCFTKRNSHSARSKSHQTSYASYNLLNLDTTCDFESNITRWLKWNCLKAYETKRL